jgi:hypothetical protein
LEVIAKAYRVHIGSQSHDDLPGYAQDFFDYITGNVHLFPVAVQEEQFKTLADRVAVKISFPVITDKTINDETDQDARKVAFMTLLGKQFALIDSSKYVPGADPNDVEAAILRFAEAVRAMLEADQWYDSIPRDALPELARYSIIGIYKEQFTSLQSTGLAFAGYGDKEFFPRMSVYRCSGIVLGKLLWAKESEVTISQENASDLVPLAMSEMIGTFIWGIGDSGFGEIMRSFRTQTAALIDALTDAGHLAGGINIDSFVDDAAKRHVRELIRNFDESHRAPLHRVIASLPVPEMAELAETLVFMESMKERVTTPTESVSGPIDVAVISKGDGFIWIKRKHYFDPKLNPRFFGRQVNT